MSTVTEQITAEQLLMMPYNHKRRELIGGEIREMPLHGLEHGHVAANFTTSLGLFVEENGLGAVVAGGTGFILARDPDTVRAPDGAFIGRDRLKTIPVGDGYYPGAPDLAVEVISPSDKYLDVESKVEDWLNAGCRMVVVANPRNCTLKVYRKMPQFSVLTVDDTFDGGDVVPGFRLPVREIFGEYCDATR
jgi:Uma2 family endonuclease